MRAIIFDMDGVLVLTGPAHFQTWRQAAAAEGIDLSQDHFNDTFGRTNPDVIRMIWKRELPPERVSQIADAKEKAFRDIVEHDVPLAPGLVPLLESLCEAGFVLGIGSSAPPENIDLVLDRAGIRKYFAGIANGSQVKRGKPAPDVFLLAARLTAVDPTHCAVVEDAPPGIEAAVAAGMVAIGVATTHPAEELTRAGAAVTFAALADLTVGRARELLGRAR